MCSLSLFANFFHFSSHKQLFMWHFYEKHILDIVNQTTHDDIIVIVT